MIYSGVTNEIVNMLYTDSCESRLSLISNNPLVISQFSVCFGLLMKVKLI